MTGPRPRRRPPSRRPQRPPRRPSRRRPPRPRRPRPSRPEPGSTEQLAQGDKVWGDSCSVCHGDTGEGKGKKNPAVVGGKALGKYKTGADLLAYVKEKMPKDDPASLSEADYLAATAWLLSKNGKLGQSGAALTAASAASVTLH